MLDNQRVLDHVMARAEDFSEYEKDLLTGDHRPDDDEEHSVSAEPGKAPMGASKHKEHSGMSIAIDSPTNTTINHHNAPKSLINPLAAVATALGLLCAGALGTWFLKPPKEVEKVVEKLVDKTKDVNVTGNMIVEPPKE